MEIKRPKVTIVIPFYNDPYVGEAIDSALAQSYDNLEIIVVDDGSTLHQDKVAPYLNRIYYLGKANGGTASALNHGFRYATGEYIAWLSSDDRFHSGKVEKQLDAMIRSGALIGHTGFNQMDAAGSLTRTSIIPPGYESGELYRALRKSNPVNGSTVMMHQSLFRLIGKFDESLPYTHDLDYWFRVLLTGIPLHLTPEALIDYRMHEAMGTVRHSAAIAREVEAVYEKYGKRWELYLTQLGYITSNTDVRSESKRSRRISR